MSTGFPQVGSGSTIGSVVMRVSSPEPNLESVFYCTSLKLKVLKMAVRDEWSLAINRRVITTRDSPTMGQMDISKDDAIAHLAKWRDAETTIRAVFTSITGTLSIVGKISSLSPSAITIAGSGSDMLLYLRTTSLFDYKDVRQVPTEANKDRANKYPTVIDIKFSNGDRVVIVEYFSG